MLNITLVFIFVFLVAKFDLKTLLSTILLCLLWTIFKTCLVSLSCQHSVWFCSLASIQIHFILSVPSLLHNLWFVFIVDIFQTSHTVDKCHHTVCIFFSRQVDTGRYMLFLLLNCLCSRFCLDDVSPVDVQFIM